jgi:(2Fe-2S) ferredoxin
VEVRVMLGTCGIAAGALDTLKTILEFIESENIHGVTVTKTGCMGLCEQEPMVQVKIGDQPRIIYGKVNPEVAEKIMKQHVQYGQPVVENLMQLFS